MNVIPDIGARVLLAGGGTLFGEVTRHLNGFVEVVWNDNLDGTKDWPRIFRPGDLISV